jgi:hypothetical protein
MPFDEDEWLRKAGQSHDKELTSPNDKLAKMDNEISNKRKQLAELKSKVDRAQIMKNQVGDKTQKGTGGLKKTEVMSADNKSVRETQDSQMRQERQDAKLQKERGQTEQGRKTP